METCIECKRKTEWYQEEEEGVYCPDCYADLIGLSAEEVWRCIG